MKKSKRTENRKKCQAATTSISCTDIHPSVALAAINETITPSAPTATPRRGALLLDQLFFSSSSFVLTAPPPSLLPVAFCSLALGNVRISTFFPVHALIAYRVESVI